MSWNFAVFDLRPTMGTIERHHKWALSRERARARARHSPDRVGPSSQLGFMEDAPVPSGERPGAFCLVGGPWKSTATLTAGLDIASFVGPLSFTAVASSGAARVV